MLKTLIKPKLHINKYKQIKPQKENTTSTFPPNLQSRKQKF